MPTAPLLLPDRAAELDLHRRLLAGDPTASADLASAYLDLLVHWLEDRNKRRVWELCPEAAETALLAVIKNPASYDRDKGTLIAYLRMSAQRDLQTLIAREQKHQRQRIPMDAVELSPDAGKYLGRPDDPSLRLRQQEEERLLMEAIPASVREGSTESELRVLHLMLCGVRKHAEFAEAYEVTHLPMPEQEREVKRVKDRLKTRLKRAKGNNERTS
jgi:hypothetical protein